MKKILIVDDEPELTEYLQRVLERTGLYEVNTTSFPEEVINICRDWKPDLLVIDIVMPNMDGREVIRELQSSSDLRSILIIVTSGLGEMVYVKKKDEWKWQPNRPVVQERSDDLVKERSAERAAEAYGVDDYLSKPFSPQTLLQVVEEVLSRGSSGSSDDPGSSDSF